MNLVFGGARPRQQLSDLRGQCWDKAAKTKMDEDSPNQTKNYTGIDSG